MPKAREGSARERSVKEQIDRLAIQAAWLLIALGVFGLIVAALDRDDLRHVPRAYREAVARAAADPAVREALGPPIEATWWREVDIVLTGATRRMRLKVDLEGSRKDGLLRLEAHRRGGRWRFDRLSVQPDGPADVIEVP